ncbi:MAG: hypothetical protein HY791_26410 [Deltaproteobacteria bacterium]|nr:hypothetical protein [Deltaproteobacteria bacterium]
MIVTLPRLFAFVAVQGLIWPLALWQAFEGGFDWFMVSIAGALLSFPGAFSTRRSGPVFAAGSMATLVAARLLLALDPALLELPTFAIAVLISLGFSAAVESLSAARPLRFFLWNWFLGSFSLASLLVILLLFEAFATKSDVIYVFY